MVVLFSDLDFSSYNMFYAGYEWDIGHFQGAQRPNVDCFRSTSFGLSESEAMPIYLF